MLLSRFWYLALAALGATALAALFMARSALDQQFSRHLEEQLQRDRYELELVLRSDARTRIDAIRGLAAHPDVRSVLRSSSGNRAIDDDARQALTRTLGSLNSQLRGFAGDLVFAVDSDGRIVAALGSEAPAGSGLGAFPLVERALGGYLRDDVWVWNDRVFRMAARPVVDQGRYIGAVVHGIEVDPDFAEQLSRSLTGATIAFFVRDRIIGSHMPSTEGAARAEDLSPHLGAALTDEALIGGGRTDPVDVADGTAQAVYSLVTGSASAAGVGYAISRPRIQIAGLGDLLNRMDFDRDLGTTNLLLLVGLALAAFLVGMGFMFLERDRPVAKLQEAARGLAEGRRDRFDLAQFRGKYRKLADGMNQALQRTFEAAGAVSQKKPPADLDDILGPTPESAEGPSFFGFAGNNVASADAAIPDVPPRPNGAAAPASDPDATPSSLFESGPRPSIADTPKAPEPAKPAAPPPPPPPLGGPPGKPAWAKGTMLGVGAPLVPSPPRSAEPKAPHGRRGDREPCTRVGGIERQRHLGKLLHPTPAHRRGGRRRRRGPDPHHQRPSGIDRRGGGGGPLASRNRRSPLP